MKAGQAGENFHESTLAFAVFSCYARQEIQNSERGNNKWILADEVPDLTMQQFPCVACLVPSTNRRSKLRSSHLTLLLFQKR